MSDNTLVDINPSTKTDLTKLSYSQLDSLKHQALTAGDTKTAEAAITQQFLLQDKAYRNP